MWVLSPVGGVRVQLHGWRYAVLYALWERFRVEVVGDGVLV